MVAAFGTRKPYDLATELHDFAPWTGPPKRTILICTHPRSGSTLLGEALYFAGHLGCPLEYFHRGFRPALEGRWNVRGIAGLTKAVHSRRTADNGVLSVKLFWQDVEEVMREMNPESGMSAGRTPAAETPPATYREIAECAMAMFPNPTWVHLIRRDTVRQAVSSVIATQSGRWRSIAGGHETPDPAVPVYDHDRIESQLATAAYCNDHWSRFFDVLGLTPYIVTYEDIDRDYESTMAALLRHLGRPVQAPPRRLQRQSDAASEALLLRFLREHEARQQVQFNRSIHEGRNLFRDDLTRSIVGG